ncbi:MAG TPA: tetratricopeptide repeat protein [Anaerolineales bacterium]|nr:tetratricopeptide repeat protein [Anaerolineales bacterium]
MHPLVRSAIETAQQGDKNRAMEFLKQALTANPNDIQAMLVLAGIVDQPDRKRQLLNRVLTLEPANRMAREELLKLDRMAMRAFHADANVSVNLPRPMALPSREASSKKPESQAPSGPQTERSSVGKSITQPVNVKNTFTKWNWVEESPTVKPQAAAELDGSLIIEKPLMFKYPLFWRILMYFCVAFFGCVGLLVASQNIVNGLLFLVLAALAGLGAMTFLPTVEVSDAGLRASGIFSSAEIRWDEIAAIKSAPMKRRLELSSKTGQVVNVSTQVSGYPRIVELIRQRRPDLFGATTAPASRGKYQSSPAIGYGNSSYPPSFHGTRTFSKSFLKQYGILFIVIPFFFFAVWTAMTEPANRVGAFIAAAFCGIMIILPFFQVSSIKVEPEKLTIETLFEEKVIRAREVKEIKMQSVRGRYGRVTNYVNIILVTSRNYPLQGFSDGDEIIYGTLLNWWESHRDQ